MTTFNSFGEFYVALAKQIASRNGVDASALTVEHLEKRGPSTWEEINPVKQQAAARSEP